MTKTKQFEAITLFDSYNAYEAIGMDRAFIIIDEAIEADTVDDLPSYVLDVMDELDVNLETLATMEPEQIVKNIDIFKYVGDDYYYYHAEAERDFTIEALESLVHSYEQQYKTSVWGYLLHGERSSHYGAIGGNGRKGTNLVRDLDDLFTLSNDDTIISINKDRNIQVDCLDHDGRTTYVVSFLTDNQVYNELDKGGYIEDEDYHLCSVFHEKAPTVMTYKAIKTFFGV